MGIEKRVVVTSEYQDHTFTVERWDIEESRVKLIYDELQGSSPVQFELLSMSKEEFKSLVESVNFVMGWGI